MKNRTENNLSFYQRHFKKKHIPCPKCKNKIDAYLDKCPYCANERSVDILPKRFLNMSLITDYKELLFFILGTFGLTLVSFLFSLGFSNFKIPQEGLKDALSNFLSYIIVLVLIYIIISHDFNKFEKQIKSQTISKRTWIFIAAGLALIIAFSYGYQYTLKACGVNIVETVNQTQVTKFVKNWPALAFFTIVLFAPIVEEFTYRVGLFSCLRKRNRYLAYIITVLIFAFVHFIPTLLTAPNINPNEAYNIPLYIIPSLVLAISYEYAGVSASIYTHLLNNLISFILILVL